MGVRSLVVIVLGCFSGLACSPMGSTGGSQAGLGSRLSEGCDSPAMSKASSASKNSATVKKWNYHQAEEGLGVASKGDSALIPMGTKVVMVIDNMCMRSGRGDEGLKQLLNDPEVEKRLKRETPRSYVSLHLDRSWYSDALKALVEGSECILTFEEAKKLTLAEFPSEPLTSLQPFWTQLNYPTVYDDFFRNINTTTTVAVIDSGMDLDHEDLSAALWTNAGEVPGNGVDDDGNGYVDDIHGYHFVNRDGDPDPSSQLSAYNIHGTAVAGLIGASENGVGVSGVMPSHIEIMSLNVFGESASTQVEDVAEAIEYAAANGARVINLSLAGRSNSSLIQTALINAVAAGVVVVVAAGNDGVEISSSNFYAPAGYAKDIDGVIAVGATIADTGVMAPYSNYNPLYVEMAAPGSYTMNSNPTGLYTLDVDNRYAHYDGTSFSAPLVAGAAALTVAWLQSQSLPFTAGDIENYLKQASGQHRSLTGLIQQCRVLDLEKLQGVLSGL